MRAFGSLTNRAKEETPMPTPAVGMGVTECLWSDRYPWTIINVISDTAIQIQADIATRIDCKGLSEAQEYEYKTDPNGATRTITRRQDGL